MNWPVSARYALTVSTGLKVWSTSSLSNHWLHLIHPVSSTRHWRKAYCVCAGRRFILVDLLIGGDYPFHALDRGPLLQDRIVHTPPNS